MSSSSWVRARRRRTPVSGSLQNGVDPDAICWIRAGRSLAPQPRNGAAGPRDLPRHGGRHHGGRFSRGVGGRPVPAARGSRHHAADRSSVTPTMATSLRIAQWEIERAPHRSERLAARPPARCGHGPTPLRPCGCPHRPARPSWCTARRRGCRYPPLVPIWQVDAIRPRPVRVGSPASERRWRGYVSRRRGWMTATRNETAVRRRTPTRQRIGSRCRSSAETHRSRCRRQERLRAWANTTTLNPARVPSDRAGRSGGHRRCRSPSRGHRTVAETAMAALAGRPRDVPSHGSPRLLMPRARPLCKGPGSVWLVQARLGGSPRVSDFAGCSEVRSIR